MFGTPKKRTTESKVFDLEVLAAKFQKKFESIDKTLTEAQDLPRRLHRLEVDERQQLGTNIEKRMSDLETTTDRVLDEIRTTIRLTGVDVQNKLKNEQAHIQNLYEKFDKLEARLNALASSKAGGLDKPSPAASTTTLSTKADDPFEGQDYSPKVKKLIKDALDTLNDSDDQR